MKRKAFIVARAKYFKVAKKEFYKIKESEKKQFCFVLFNRIQNYQSKRNILIGTCKGIIPNTFFFKESNLLKSLRWFRIALTHRQSANSLLEKPCIN